MKTTRKIGLVTALIVSSVFASQAQTSTPASSSTPSSDKEWRISVGPETGIPTGNYANGYGWFIGGSAQLDIPGYDGLYVTDNCGNDAPPAKKSPQINITVYPGRTVREVF